MGSPTCISAPQTPLNHHHQRHNSSHSPTRPQQSRRSSRNYHHYPLSPPGVTSAAATVVTRPELNRSATSTSSPRATALLSKVVSAPGSRRCSPPRSVVTSPINEKDGMHFHDVHRTPQSGELSPQWDEVLRYWQRNEQRGNS